MEDDKDRILEGLKQAMQTEVDGHNFYKMAASQTQDSIGKEAFQSLAQDEIEHFIFLKAQYSSIMENGHVDMNVSLNKPSQSGESPIFSQDFKKRIKDAHIEMSALSVGAQLELASIKFYDAQAKTAADPEVKKFYGELAEWEKTHHRRLLRQQKELQEDYFYNNKFYPF